MCSKSSFFFPLTVLMKTRVRNSFLLLGYVSIYNDVFIVWNVLLYLAQSVFVFNLSAGGESGDCWTNVCHIWLVILSIYYILNIAVNWYEHVNPYKIWQNNSRKKLVWIRIVYWTFKQNLTKKVYKCVF